MESVCARFKKHWVCNINSFFFDFSLHEPRLYSGIDVRLPVKQAGRINIKTNVEFQPATRIHWRHSGDVKKATWDGG